MTQKGKHPEKALTAVKVRNVKAPGRYTDGGGLYLIVDPSGAKRWMLRTTVQGKRSDIGLGGVKTVSLAEARDEAFTMRRIARQGGNPLLERRNSKKVVPTFADAARTVHAEHKKSWKNVKHQAQWINTLIEYVFPVFGDHTVDRISSADVLKTLSPIWLEKPETARRVKQRIKVVFDWAKAAGFRSGDNPVDGVSKVLPKQNGAQQHHTALPYAEVPAFVSSLNSSANADIVTLALEFLILTGTRTGEVIGATWDEIDAESKTWTVPAERMKAGRAHRVPLSSRCMSILKRAEKHSDHGKFIFPGRTGNPLSNMAFLMALRRMGHDFTVHGFRSSFRDFAAERTNFPREVCEAALAHSLRDKTEAAYNRTDLFSKRRRLMEVWAKFVRGKRGNVVPIGKRA